MADRRVAGQMSQDTYPLVLEGEIDRLFDADGTDQAFRKLARVFGFRFHNTGNPNGPRRQWPINLLQRGARKA